MKISKDKLRDKLSRMLVCIGFRGRNFRECGLSHFSRDKLSEFSNCAVYHLAQNVFLRLRINSCLSGVSYVQRNYVVEGVSYLQRNYVVEGVSYVQRNHVVEGKS